MPTERVNRLLEVVSWIDEHKDLDLAVDEIDGDGKWLITESEMDETFPEDLKAYITELRDILFEARDEDDGLDNALFREMKRVGIGHYIISVAEEDNFGPALYKLESLSRDWCVGF